MTAGVIPLDTLTAPERHVFLSPHYDDIALSCGGTAALLARSGRTPEIVVIFGSPPDPEQPLSGFAKWQHERWGVTATDAIAHRRAEEEAAARLLSATVRVLPFRDAIYRGERYTDDSALFGEPAPDESALPVEIASAVRALLDARRTTRVYAPLAIGKHVDHQLLYQAAVDLTRNGADVWLYEDLPYAARAGAVDARLRQLEDQISVVGLVRVGSVWDVKIDAIMSYGSQLAAIFGGIAEPPTRDVIDRALRDYGKTVGQGEAAERFWRTTR